MDIAEKLRLQIRPHDQSSQGPSELEDPTGI